MSPDRRNPLHDLLDKSIRIDETRPEDVMLDAVPRRDIAPRAALHAPTGRPRQPMGP